MQLLAGPQDDPFVPLNCSGRGGAHRNSKRRALGYAETEVIQGLISQTVLPFLNPSGNGKRGEN